MFPPAACAALAVMGTTLLISLYFVWSLYRTNCRLHGLLHKQLDAYTKEEMDTLVKAIITHDL